MTEITGTIRNARILDIGGGRSVIAGDIYGDVRGRFEDGEAIFTSTVEDITGDIAKTKNSTYRFTTKDN